jgi:3-methyl-2-oxobutanoate hydroxymethyltransferase
LTPRDLCRRKRQGPKIVAVVLWDTQMARIADRAGVDLVSVGDSVGSNLWGRDNPLDVTLDELLLVAAAVRRGTSRAVVSCDFPYGPLQLGPRAAVRAAIALVKGAGVDMVKLDDAPSALRAVEAVVTAGIPVIAQFGITPQSAARHGVDPATITAGDPVPDDLTEELVGEARRLESAGATLLDFTHSGPIVGPAVVDAVSIPVIGGLGGGPWLDGRIRLLHSVIGYRAEMLDAPHDTYADVARITLDALAAYRDDVRSDRQARTGRPL